MIRPDQDADAGIFSGIVAKAGLAALTEVCALRVFLFF